MESRILTALIAEANLYDVERKGFINEVRARANKPSLPSPLPPTGALPDLVRALRHSFWPSMASKMPLLAFAASVILTAPLTTNTNEGFHSMTSFLSSRHRAATSPETLELLAVGHVMLKEEAVRNERPKAVPWTTLRPTASWTSRPSTMQSMAM